MAESNECQSCKEERAKKGLPPMERVILPADSTANANFRKRDEPTVVCAYCDGETLISTAMKAHQARQAE